tara:strand:+ start:2950 stop:3759 length:810 start_codon:yes stop_codon:yes gene_type:complete
MTVTTSLVALLILLSFMSLIWLISVILRNSSIVDIFWGIAFILLSYAYTNSVETLGLRQVIVLLAVHSWALRLSLYLLWRNWNQPEDARYLAMRTKWGARWATRSLFVVFWLQGTVAWVVSFPLHLALTSPLTELTTFTGIAGLALFLFGFLFEVIADWQLAQFKANPHNKNFVCNQGLWRYTRHPNYFGEAVLWWGLSLFAITTTSTLWVLLSPALMTVLLLKFSGVVLLEKNLNTSKQGYGDYKLTTNAFVPWFPRRAREHDQADVS